MKTDLQEGILLTVWCGWQHRQALLTSFSRIYITKLALVITCHIQREMYQLVSKAPVYILSKNRVRRVLDNKKNIVYSTKVSS